MMASVIDIIDALGEVFPWQLAPAGDGGLLVGSPDSPVDRVMCCLDPCLDVVRAAVGAGCQVLVAHHPHLLGAGGNLHRDYAAAAIVRESCLGGLSLVGCHANADMAEGGAADALASRLGLQGARPLAPAEGVYIAKVVVFVPPGRLDEVSAAMSGAGAGTIGDYTNCGFRAPGRGTFMPGPGTHPFSGRPGELSIEDEVRLEMVAPSFRVEAVADAMLAAHPYDEVAYDVYRTENPVPWGAGRVGDLQKKKTAGELADELAAWCGSGAPALDGPRRETVTRVAVAPGSGDGLVNAALAEGARLLVTGELRWHEAVTAREAGMAVLRLGHPESERHLVPLMVEGLRAECVRRGLPVSVEGYVEQEGRRG